MDRVSSADISNWKLLKGAHDFPGADGGTCLNEAAVVAAGYRYRSVCCILDMPACFSHVIAHYAMILNDAMPSGPGKESWFHT